MRLRMVMALGVAVLACGAVLLLWSSVGAPLAEVRYSFALNDVPELADLDGPLTFALIADVHLRETPRAEIPDRLSTERILDKFLRSMHEEVRPDFIVQLGDVIDGWTDTCQPIRYDSGCSIATTDVIVRRLERVTQLTKAKTHIPWFDVIGNHEYLGASPEEIPDRLRAIREEWTATEDTWYYRDVKGVRLIFLNTAHPPPVPEPGGPHLIPEQELTWLAEVLRDTDKPVFVFMHVPVSGGDGTPYDVALNRESVTKMLAESDNFVAGFFGHSHHTDAWDGLRSQRDSQGNLYFHVPAPHQWMGDASQNPWIVVRISPQGRAMHVEVGTGVARSGIREFITFARESLNTRITGLRFRLSAD